MARLVKVAAAQMGPNQEGTPREAIVARMLALADQAAADGVQILAYPEMALTPYFPKRIRADADQFFDADVPPRGLEPVLARARRAGMVCHVGFCERTGPRRFNTALLADGAGRICGTFRKIHLPGHNVAGDGGPRVYEPYYFDSGDTGFRVFPTEAAQVGIAICQDRRYGETYRCLGLAGAEIVLIGYNTPAAPLALAQNELVMRAGAYENHLFAVGIAKAGVEDGVELIGGSCIIAPTGEVIARAATSGDELVAARIDLAQITEAKQRWNFFARRHPEHYGAVAAPLSPEIEDPRVASRPTARV